MTRSAHVGQPPNTDDDYWIVKGMYRDFGDDEADPSIGYALVPSRPASHIHEDKQAGIILAMTIVMSIMVFITGLRLGLRVSRPCLRFGEDDWVLIPGAAMAIAYPTIQIVMVTCGGGGKHTWDVTYAEYNIFNWLGVVCKILFFVSVGIIKISITLFNRRLTAMTSGYWRIANDIFLGLLVAYTFLALFWTCFQCQPPAAKWNKIYAGKLKQPAVCYSTENISNVLSIIHVIMDFCLLTTPVIILWKIKMPWTTKLRLYAIFSMGAISCIGSVMRQLAQNELNPDVLWSYTGVLKWTLVDLTSAVITASLPVLSGLLPKAWRSAGYRSRSRSRPTCTNSGTLGSGRQRRYRA
ncbi:hypothetical protein K490DRAFT_73584 [Saccharata proteae CBS 121410]|uniref:Rhodopsin domain-containing protein n=1 Tax=Saccharata proteae CBS 121410 TaxID=1314787 RepID=A0A9P4HX51_9PEZI|nr:hypothetical protein K490DRAFT_73584 [Saccharata proteae CBS 121410]